MSKYLNKNDILGISDLKQEEVDVPEWGGTVLVRSLTGAERDQYESSMYELKGKKVNINMKNIRALLVCLSVIDEDGNRLFTLDEVSQLGDKNANALNRVAEVAARLSGLSQTDEQRLSTNLKNG